jgi:hypothetical protein
VRNPLPTVVLNSENAVMILIRVARTTRLLPAFQKICRRLVISVRRRIVRLNPLNMSPLENLLNSSLREQKDAIEHFHFENAQATAAGTQ